MVTTTIRLHRFRFGFRSFQVWLANCTLFFPEIFLFPLDLLSEIDWNGWNTLNTMTQTKQNETLCLHLWKKKFAVPVLINSVTWCGIKASDKKKKRIKKAYVPLIDNHLTSDQTKWKKWRRKREEKSMFTTFLSYEIMIIIFTGNMWNIRSAHFRDSLAWIKKLSTTEQNETIA